MNDAKIARLLSLTLRGGIAISAMLLLFGLCLSYFAQPSLADMGFLLEELGVFALFATPVLRVAISVAVFAANRDKLFFFITAVVLINIVFAMLIVPIMR